MQSRFLEEVLCRYPSLKPCEASIIESFEVLRDSFAQNGKLLLVGNGGSASDADHIAGELLKSFRGDKTLSKGSTIGLNREAEQNLQHALPAIPLPHLTAIVTAFCNDCNPEWTFAQLVWGLGQRSDVLWSLSTSGNAKNVCRAAEVARAKQIKVIGLTGKSGGALKALCDVCICVPESETFKVQELHLPVYHCLCAMLEAHFFT